MNRIEFDELVESLEQSYRERQESLTAASLRWALLGYLVLALALVLNAALAAGAVALIIHAPNGLTIKLGGAVAIAAGAICITILRSVWIRLSPPDGAEIRRTDAPGLFHLIDSVSRASGGVKFHRVLLTPELNASVVQVPQAGVFGFYKNHLSLGLPLLDSLEPDEFKAVLAHEFSHLSKKDGRTGNWLYRIRATWEQVAVGIFHRPGILIAPLRNFLGWFWPRFNARAFVLSRFNEYRADSFAASVTSPATIGDALCRIQLAGRHLEDGFWESVGKRVAEEPFPPKSVFHDMKAHLSTQPDPDSRRRWLAQAFAAGTGTADTHPSLTDRMRALGGDPAAHSLAPPTGNATDAFLGTFGESIRLRFDQDWHRNNAPGWNVAHLENLDLKKKLDEARQRLEAREPTADEAWEILELQLRTGGVGPHLTALRAFTERHPAKKQAQFILGSHLLSEDDPSGIPVMEKLARNPADTIDCLGVIAGYYDRQGNREAVRSLKERADLHDARMNPAMRARNSISAKDTFIAHGLDDKTLGSIRAAIQREKAVRSAFLVRKKHSVFEDWNHYVIALELKFPVYRFVSDSARIELLQRIVDGIRVDGYVLAIDDHGSMKSACKAIRRQQPDAEIYSKA